jgi:hypothetical protein
MGQITTTLVRQSFWRSPKPAIGIAWYREAGTDPGVFANDRVIVAMNALEFPGGVIPHEIRVTVGWDESKAGTSPPTAGRESSASSVPESSSAHK